MIRMIPCACGCGTLILEFDKRGIKRRYKQFHHPRSYKKGEEHPSWKPKIKIKCEICGKVLYKTKKAFSKSKHHFCSYKCWSRGFYLFIDRSSPPKGKLSPHWKRIKTKCDYCFSIIEIALYEKKTLEHHFCNRKCHGLWLKKNLRGKNNPFFNKTHSQKNRKIISKANKGKIISEVNKIALRNLRGKKSPVWNSSEIICESCGKKFFKPKSHIKRNKHHFCGSKCYFQWHRGKNITGYIGIISPYPQEFNSKLREKIRLRDNHKCQLCGTPQKESIYKLSVHHIDYDKGNIDELDLITLCRSCHNKTNTNRKFWKAYFEEKIIQIYKERSWTFIN